MIVITDKNIENSVKIPVNTGKTEGQHTLTLFSTVSKNTVDITFTDTSLSPFFYAFYYTFSEFANGEYEYEVDGNTGMLRIGENQAKTIYNNEISFKQYEC